MRALFLFCSTLIPCLYPVFLPSFYFVADWQDHAGSVCGKAFLLYQALGGHKATSHRTKPSVPAPATDLGDNKEEQKHQLGAGVADGGGCCHLYAGGH